MVKCSSETETLPEKSLVKLPFPWHSHEFNLLAQKRDQIHIHKKMNTKGPKFVQNFTIKNRCQAPKPPMSHKISDVTRSLPINCYTLYYLIKLTDTQKLLLNPKPHINLEKLLEMKQILCGWSIWLFIHWARLLMINRIDLYYSSTPDRTLSLGIHK